MRFTIPSFPPDCAECHSQNAWMPVPYPRHEQLFPIRSGAHGGIPCNDCHTDPADIREFTCLEPCHTRSRMDREHDEISTEELRCVSNVCRGHVRS